MVVNPITAWLLSLLVHLVPPSTATPVPGWPETTEQRTARYESVASDLYEVLYDPSAVLLFTGPKARAKTAVVMLAIARAESAFDPDVDKGPCIQGKSGKRCDGGRSACLMQVNVGAGKTFDGWTKADLFGDRKKCFRAALRIAKDSFVGCPSLGPDARLNLYATGRCDAGMADSRRKLRTAEWLLNLKPVPEDAAYVIAPPPPPTESGKLSAIIGQ